jgi:formylglycine-generating enzyme required for sulfatase activity
MFLRLSKRASGQRSVGRFVDARGAAVCVVSGGVLAAAVCVQTAFAAARESRQQGPAAAPSPDNPPAPAAPAQSAPKASDVAPAQPVTPGKGFRQEVEGSTFVIELVPFEVPAEVPAEVAADAPAKSGAKRTLYVSTTEIPWDLFDVFVYGTDKSDGKSNEKADAVTKPTKPYIGMDRDFGRVGFPVISPTFLSAKQFCEWLSAKTGRTYRLPTAAEWTALCEQSGIDPKNSGDYAWVKENSNEKTHKLGSKKADKLGLFDLFGNACEWVDDGSKLGVVAGGSYLDSVGDLGCGVFAPCKPVEWNEIDPQFPKSKWWYSSGGFVGFRVICEAK